MDPHLSRQLAGLQQEVTSPKARIKPALLKVHGDITSSFMIFSMKLVDEHFITTINLFYELYFTIVIS